MIPIKTNRNPFWKTVSKHTFSPPVHKSWPSELNTPAISSADLACLRSPWRSPTTRGKKTSFNKTYKRQIYDKKSKLAQIKILKNQADTQTQSLYIQWSKCKRTTIQYFFSTIQYSPSKEFTQPFSIRSSFSSKGLLYQLHNIKACVPPQL